MGAVISLVFICLGITGNQTTGFIYRYNQSDRYLASFDKWDAGKYVEKQFGNFKMKAFDSADHRKKILIIGDSFAQDLVNALYASGFTQHIQIATRHLDVRCGNLLMPQKDFIQKIIYSDRLMCEGKGLFEDADLHKLMISADQIWFASAWLYWQAQLIEASVANVESFSARPVKVFGLKDFGKVDIKHLLSTGAQERMKIKGRVSTNTLQTTTLMKRTLSLTVFVDVQQMLCGVEVDFCALFTNEGELISYDGMHLTEFGAMYFGKKLVEYNSLMTLTAR